MGVEYYGITLLQGVGFITWGEKFDGTQLAKFLWEHRDEYSVFFVENPLGKNSYEPEKDAFVETDEAKYIDVAVFRHDSVIDRSISLRGDYEIHASSKPLEIEEINEEFYTKRFAKAVDKMEEIEVFAEQDVGYFHITSGFEVMNWEGNHRGEITEMLTTREWYEKKLGHAYGPATRLTGGDAEKTDSDDDEKEEEEEVEGEDDEENAWEKMLKRVEENLSDDEDEPVETAKPEKVPEVTRAVEPAKVVAESEGGAAGTKRVREEAPIIDANYYLIECDVSSGIPEKPEEKRRKEEERPEFEFHYF